MASWLLTDVVRTVCALPPRCGCVVLSCGRQMLKRAVERSERLGVVAGALVLSQVQLEQGCDGWTFSASYDVGDGEDDAVGGDAAVGVPPHPDAGAAVGTTAQDHGGSGVHPVIPTLPLKGSSDGLVSDPKSSFSVPASAGVKVVKVLGATDGWESGFVYVPFVVRRRELVVECVLQAAL